MSVFAAAAMYYDSEPNYTLLYVLLGIVVLVVQWVIAKRFGSIAFYKGYPEDKYFWYSFLFGIAGYLMVVALPNLREHRVTETSGIEKPQPAEEEPMSAGTWRCPACGREKIPEKVTICACGRSRWET